MNFNPREAAREVLASTALTDPTEIADAVFEATPKAAIPGRWSDGHRHADALRITSKALLRDLWRASRDIHNGRTLL